MNFLSVKQVSEKWGITPRRIAQLACQGRIPGVQQIDGRWFIPENAEKPTDPRRQKHTSPVRDNDRYIFPYPLSVVNSDSQIDSFNDEEKKLYHLCLLYESGSFSEARECGKALLSSANIYIRVGALYLLSTVCMYLSDFRAVEDYFLLFHTTCLNIKDHRDEINILRSELCSELGDPSSFVRGVDLSVFQTCSPEFLPLFGTCKLIADVLLCIEDGKQLDISSFEIICRMTEWHGWFYCAMIMHIYLSMYYAARRDTVSEYRHMKSAFEIGLEHDTLFTVSYSFFYNPETAETLLSNYPADIRDRVRELAGIFVTSRNAYAKYKGKKTLLSQLTENDYRLIACCLKGNTISQMAESFGLTRSGINKRLSNLYARFKVRSKNELIRVYLSSLLDWRKE